MSREILERYIWALVARTARYHWGGDDPIRGFDCSGLVSELLQAAGVLRHGERLVSSQLFHRFNGIPADPTQFGDLAFYGKSVTQVGHVAFCLGAGMIVEAGGGNAQTVDEKTAVERNAFVRVRPLHYRPDFLGAFAPPGYPWIR